MSVAVAAVAVDDGPLRGKPLQARSARTIAAILDAAESLIADDGQAGFTVDRLAVQAGVSVASVYYWFHDLGSVVVAAVQRIVDDFTPVVVDAQDVCTDTRVEMLRGFIGKHPSLLVLALSGRPEPHRARLWSMLETMFGGDAASIAVAHLDWHRHLD